MQGDMIRVIQSLKALKASFSDDGYDKNTLSARRRWSLPADHSKGVDSNFNDGGSQFIEASEINTSHHSLQVKFSNIMFSQFCFNFDYDSGLIFLNHKP